jgi:hypothetical protein
MKLVRGGDARPRNASGSLLGALALAVATGSKEFSAGPAALLAAGAALHLRELPGIRLAELSLPSASPSACVRTMDQLSGRCQRIPDLCTMRGPLLK